MQMNSNIAPPNQMLRHHRRMRGWSQQRVAELLATTEDMVSRWERGVNVPSPFYQEKLCAIFQKDASELGFIGKELVFPQRKRSTAQQAGQSQSDDIKITPYFSFGHIETTWIVADGDGINEYLSQNIRSYFTPRADPLPEELLQRRKQIEEQQERNRRDGLPSQWNGERYSLDRFVISRSPIDEAMTLDLWFRPSDYYNYLATNISLEDPYLRAKYIHDVDWHSPVRYFSNSFGVSIAVITSDQYVLLTRRGRNLGSRPSNYNTSVSEGLSKPIDSGTSTQAPDMFRCASRGLAEELGLSEHEDYSQADIIFLSFGVDTQFSQWGLRGMVKVQKRAGEVINNWNTGVKDKIENSCILPIKFEPSILIPFVFSHTPWAPAGLVCLYHALIHEFGKKEVNKAINMSSK